MNRRTCLGNGWRVGLVATLGAWTPPGLRAQAPVRAASAGASTALAADAAAWRVLLSGRGIALFRHAQAPGTGDPPGFRLDDCATQRNLDETGREQARRIGAELRARRVPVAAVWSSQWCRARETAQLMDVGPVVEQPAFNSFFDDRAREARYVEAARRALLAFDGARGSLIVVTHQVHITGLTGIFPASGEGVVLQRDVQGALLTVGRILI